MCEEENVWSCISVGGRLYLLVATPEETESAQTSGLVLCGYLGLLVHFRLIIVGFHLKHLRYETDFAAGSSHGCFNHPTERRLDESNAVAYRVYILRTMIVIKIRRLASRQL